MYTCTCIGENTCSCWRLLKTIVLYEGGGGAEEGGEEEKGKGGGGEKVREGIN